MPRGPQGPRGPMGGAQLSNRNRMQNQMQAAQEPYTRLEIGQNLLKGIPSAGLSSTFKSATTPATNPFLAGIGAYTALQGIKPSGTSA